MRIGSIELGNKPLFLAPMEDVTDQPFRLTCKELGADVLVTEFTSIEALIRNVQKAKERIHVLDAERPVGIQIFGINEDSFSRAVEIVALQKPDFIDINAGCCARKHAARGEGAGLLRDLKNFEKIVKRTVVSSPFPVTVKTRLGWDHDSIVILDVAQMVEDCGAVMLTVHCRTKQQMYKGQADWSWLEKIRKVISIPLIGNGDVTDPEHAKTLLECGCDGVMIGRAALQNPWIFKQVKHFFQTGQRLPEVTLNERVQVCKKHLQYYAHHKGTQERLYAFRKFYSGYFRDIPGSSKLRVKLMKQVDASEIERTLTEFLTHYPTDLSKNLIDCH